MKTRAFNFIAFFGLIIASCNSNGASENSNPGDTVKNTYGNPDGNDRTLQGDSVIDRGMGDSAGVQAGGTKVNVGTDTVGKQPHDN